MAFIPTPNAVRATVLGTVSDQAAFTTLWFIGSAPATLTDLSNLGANLQGWLAGDLLPLLSNGFSVDGVNLLAQDSDSAPSLNYTTSFPLTGAVNSPTQAPQVAGVVSFRTANRGRSGRGRNYVPGIPEVALDTPGTMGPTFRAALVAAYEDLNPSVSVHGYVHVVVSHFHDHLPRSSGLVQAVTTYIVDAPLDTQRRRSVGRGV